MQGSFGGIAVTLALLNAWLASRSGRSGGRWFLGSLLLAPGALLLTVYLVRRFEPAPTLAARPIWDRVKLAALAIGVMVLAVMLLTALGGQPEGGALIVGGS
jgi:hypothetical protein